jgi:hypothetical protein
MRNERWGTRQCGLRTQLRILWVVVMAAGAIMPRSVSAQSKPDVSDATLTLNAGDAGEISILGRSLTLFARAEVLSVDTGARAEGITASFARASGSSRILTIRTGSTVAPGDYTINVVSRIRRRTYTLDFTLTVEGDADGLGARPPQATRAPLPQASRPQATRPTRPRASRPQATRPTRPQATRPQATRPTAARNAPPRVISVTPPAEIEADVAFDLGVQAGDDKGLAEVTVTWRRGTATAAFSGGTDETVNVSLPRFAAGRHAIRVVVRDEDGVQSRAWSGQITAVAAPAPVLPTLSAIVVSASSAQAGDVLVGTVRLDTPAVADVEVILAVTDPGAIDVPSLVTVPTGQLEATFSINVVEPDRDTDAAVIASYGGQKMDARLQVLGPPSLDILEVGGADMEGDVAWVDKPGLVRGAGRVVLARSAPVGGTVVTLSSDRPDLVTLPAQVTVPSGQTELRFDIENQFTPSLVDVLVTAQVGGVTRSDIYRLKPTLESLPVQILFSALGGGETSSVSVVGGQPFGATVVFNKPVGAEGATIYVNAGRFLIEGGTTQTVPAGTQRFDLRFTPPEVDVPTSVRVEVSTDGSFARLEADVEVQPVPSQLESITFEPAWTLPFGPPVIATATFAETTPVERTVTLTGTTAGGTRWRKSLTVPAGETQGQLLVQGLHDIQQQVATDPVEITAAFMGSATATTVMLHRTQMVDGVELSSSGPFYGEEVIATIMLRDPAAPGGFELALTGAGTALLTSPPQSVLVPSGEISVDVPLVSNRTGLGVRSVALALRNDLGPTYGFTFELNPAPELSGITHPNAFTAPPPLPGGTEVEVKLLLMSDPSRPVSVTLTSSDPGVISVPAEVTVSSRETLVSVQAALDPAPGETASATITASLGGQEISRVLTVIPNNPFIVSMEVLPHTQSGELVFYPGEDFLIRALFDRDLRPLNAQFTVAASEPELLESLTSGDASSQSIVSGRLAAFDAPRTLTITGSLGGTDRSVDVELVMPYLERFEVFDTGSVDQFLTDLVFPLPDTKCALFVSVPRAIFQNGFGFPIPFTVTTSRDDLMQVPEPGFFTFATAEAGIRRVNVDCNVAGAASLITEPTPITIEVTVGGGVTISKTITLHPQSPAVPESLDFSAAGSRTPR